MGGFNLGGINASGQVRTFRPSLICRLNFSQIPSLMGNFGLIDHETPTEVLTKTSYTNSKEQLQLVFSDEFNTEGRSFYPGDDPYWEAVDLHYWAVCISSSVSPSS
jgi:hypothetical protein